MSGGAVKKIDTTRLARLVAETLGKRFKDITIVKVDVSPGSDRDGDNVLRIRVVFKGVLKGADAKHVAGAAREVWPVLEDEVEDDFFPLLSFVSKIDYDRGHKCEAN